MVINIGALKSGDDCLVEDDIRAVAQAAHENGVLLKVIIETALLTDEEKVRACLASKNAGADFVKTSTGFAKGGATVDDVSLMRRTVGSALGVKASGGVKGIDDARAMFEAGATHRSLGRGENCPRSIRDQDHIHRLGVLIKIEIELFFSDLSELPQKADRRASRKYLRKCGMCHIQVNSGRWIVDSESENTERYPFSVISYLLDCGTCHIRDWCP